MTALYKKDEAWYQALLEEVKRTSQNKCATKVGVNASYINAVLTGKPFPGRLDRFISRIEGALLNQTVQCPVAGEISKDLCASHQRQPFSNANSMRVKLYKACRNNCPNSKLEVQHET